jgi:membrane protein implicated in regulation of membrane protease activity
MLLSDARLLGQTTQRPHRRAHSCLEEDDLMGIRIPNLAVLLLSLGIGALAIYLENVAVAVICFSIAAFYAALTFWLWKRRKKKG